MLPVRVLAAVPVFADPVFADPVFADPVFAACGAIPHVSQ
jgi:hypothetical protein